MMRYRGGGGGSDDGESGGSHVLECGHGRGEERSTQALAGLGPEDASEAQAAVRQVQVGWAEGKLGKRGRVRVLVNVPSFSHPESRTDQSQAHLRDPKEVRS